MEWEALIDELIMKKFLIIKECFKKRRWVGGWMMMLMTCEGASKIVCPLRQWKRLRLMLCACDNTIKSSPINKASKKSINNVQYWKSPKNNPRNKRWNDFFILLQDDCQSFYLHIEIYAHIMYVSSKGKKMENKSTIYV